ncbi:Uu.00g006280.m01.CDS01 [Anthostomella pinea]|uniref:Uu.00g006280.m01.CDS01 n=1 Tax=Anthostomella pinea TaxID=933095 RepID=A0AAI8YJ39_9PEZI|nr:Uu.00g006280.m01.CDS01 [Anthostomella pinea]
MSYYNMTFYVSSGFRDYPRSSAIGAVAACSMFAGGNLYWYTTAYLDRRGAIPTEQRAGITAIVVALEWALYEYDNRRSGNPPLRLTIYSDSEYVTRCMRQNIAAWERNDCVHSDGRAIYDLDLWRYIAYLNRRVRDLGPVYYMRISREENIDAVPRCIEALDRRESEEQRGHSQANDESF